MHPTCPPHLPSPLATSLLLEASGQGVQCCGPRSAQEQWTTEDRLLILSSNAGTRTMEPQRPERSAHLPKATQQQTMRLQGAHDMAPHRTLPETQPKGSSAAGQRGPSLRSISRKRAADEQGAAGQQHMFLSLRQLRPERMLLPGLSSLHWMQKPTGDEFHK